MTDFKKEIAELNQEINELNQEVAELRKEIKEYKNHVKESDRFTDVITLKEKKENLLIQQKNLLLEKQLKLMAMTFPAGDLCSQFFCGFFLICDISDIQF